MSLNITELKEHDFYIQQIIALGETDGARYTSASLYATSFAINPGVKFSIKLLRELYTEDNIANKIDGKLLAVNFNHVKNGVDEVLSFHNRITQGKKVAQARAHIYWTLVSQILGDKYPPKKCYDFADYERYFCPGFVSFCFILVNDNRGVVLIGNITA